MTPRTKISALPSSVMSRASTPTMSRGSANCSSVRNAYPAPPFEGLAEHHEIAPFEEHSLVVPVFGQIDGQVEPGFVVRAEVPVTAIESEHLVLQLVCGGRGGRARGDRRSGRGSNRLTRAGARRARRAGLLLLSRFGEALPFHA